MKNPLYPFTIVNDNLTNYNRCLVITLEKIHEPSIFSKDISSYEYFENINQNYKMTSIPIHVIKMITNFQNNFILFDVKEDDLLLFKFDGKTLENESIVYNLNEAILLLPNHNWEWFYDKIEMFIKDGIKDMNTYLFDYKDSLSQKINSDKFNDLMFHIRTSKDVLYWSNINKCQLNITSDWLKRDINFSDAKEINISLQKELEYKCNNYLQNDMNKYSYVDASSGVKTHKFKLYYIDDYKNISIDKAIYNLLILDNMFYTNLKLNTDTIINCCLISKKYTQCILKNENILKYIQNNINIFKKSFSYAWLMMYLEEGILKSFIKKEDRCIFTLEEASKLPITNTTMNMYIPLMVESNFIHMFGGYRSNSKKTIQLSNIEEFKNRLKIFVTNYNIDIFQNLDWKNLAISGSVIAAACRKYDPLEIDGGFTTNEFFNTYYENSDIDVMCDLPDYKSFIDKVMYLVSVISDNIKEAFPMEDSLVTCIPIKTVALHLTKKYVNEKYNGKITDDEAYAIYINMKTKEIKIDDIKYEKINEIVSIDNFKYYVYNTERFDNNMNYNSNPTYTENIKYHISSPYMRRSLEVFKIKFTFMATVSRFHLPCVRGYYDGSQVYLLPSAISALLTNKCIDYKYFAGVRSPFDIILKYIFRGYSIILNKKELIKIVEFIKNTPKWLHMYNAHNMNIRSVQLYYTNPFVLLNKAHVNYTNYCAPFEHNLISDIISSLGYIIPY
jgi:hypothetical protein